MKDRKNKSTSKPGRFTLIELLLVITVIAILAGMLLPTLAQSRKIADQISCAGHLKQLSQLFIGYANDFYDWLPESNGSNYDTTSMWCTEFMEYMEPQKRAADPSWGYTRLAYCPVLLRKRVHWQHGQLFFTGAKRGFLHSSSYTFTCRWNRRNYTGDLEKWEYTNNQKKFGAGYEADAVVTELPNLSYAGTLRTKIGGKTFFSGKTFGTCSQMPLMGCYYMFDPTSWLCNRGATDPQFDSTLRWPYPHKGGIAAYADGHVVFWAPEKYWSMTKRWRYAGTKHLPLDM